MIRRAAVEDASRIAEILVFTKRMNYRKIFQNDKVSFGEIQVYPIERHILTIRKNWKASGFTTTSLSRACCTLPGTG